MRHVSVLMIPCSDFRRLGLQVPTRHCWYQGTGMKVFYVTMVFPATSETFACGDVRNLRRSGVDVSVHALRRPVPGWRKMLEERGLSDLTVIHGSWRNFFVGLGLLIRYPGRFLVLLAWLIRCSATRPVHLLKGLALMPRAMHIFAHIVREQPDVVHLFWGHYPSIVGFLVQRFQPQIKVSIFLGAYDLLTGFAGSSWVAIRAHTVWTHAGCNVRSIRDWGIPEENIRVCHRGIDLSFTRERAKTKVPRRILSAGRLVKNKGMDGVLRIFGQIVRRWPDATLVILGGGKEEERLKILARELKIEASVYFGGHVPHEEVFRQMAAAEVFILLTSHLAERLPNAVKEAMACRCLCLVTNSPGIEELVIDGKTGFILPKDEAAFARRVDEIFDHPERFAAMAEAAEDFVKEHFDASRQMALYRQAWEKLISSVV